MLAWGPFLLYAFVTSITPGPNNIMSMSLGIQIGFFRTLRFNAGVLTGFFSVMLLCTFFCTTLNHLLPQVRLPMLIAGTAYLMWLAWKIWKATYNTDPKADAKASYWMGVFLQFLNVKIYFYAIIAMQMYILPHYSDPLVLALFAFLLAFIGTSCNLVWSSFGAAFAKVFTRYTKPVNLVLAASLLFCALSFWK